MSILLDEAQAYENSRDMTAARSSKEPTPSATRSTKPTAPDGKRSQPTSRSKPWREDCMPSEDCFWTLAEPEMRANYLSDARKMLEIARKAVNE